MTWREHEAEEENPYSHAGRPGGDWHGVRPSFDNPMTWSLPLGRVAGITVRIHAIFLLFVVVELLRSIYAAPVKGGQPSFGPEVVLLMLLGMFWAVLLHEFGHCIACRLTGGAADEILMWPLGGLATCDPPQRWQAHFYTAAGGPLVNVILLVFLIPLLGTQTGLWLGVAIPNPLTLSGLSAPAIIDSWWMTALYLFTWVNLVLLLFNVLLPMFPLDGGRMLQAALWPRIGYGDSMRITVRAGYIGAILIGVLGLVMGQTMLVLVAVFGGLTCWTTYRQLQFTEEVMGLQAFPGGFDDDDGEDEEEERVSAREERRARQESEQSQKEAEELDRILRKISDGGIESLTARERKLLNKATERRRRKES